MIKTNLVGCKIGKLTVLEYKGKRTYKCGASDNLWLCRCDCGNIVIRTQYTLRRGTSCGCERRRKVSESLKTHGGTHTKLYYVWRTMKSRCSNPHTHSFKDYGGRGISICDEWHDFRNFQDWAIKNGYKEGLQIDRIDVNGNYEPCNCRWVDIITQARNKRNNHKVEWRGAVYTLSQIERMTGVDHRLIGKRLKRGWDVERAITQKPIEKHRCVKLMKSIEAHEQDLFNNQTAQAAV